MRIDPTLQYKKQKDAASQQKITAVTRKVAIYFILMILVLLFLKMILPSSV
ncbi:hypothetical protein [Parasediminibacterium sp. JCM 36343]|uniref:hypothetical protein n=1 Tax=Parasediminibacterium sp. JCM 36343 TaxID=3374279 RepID=UPI00397B30DC